MTVATKQLAQAKPFIIDGVRDMLQKYASKIEGLFMYIPRGGEDK